MLDLSGLTRQLVVLAWAYSKGAKMAEELDYVPMPDSVVASVRGIVP
jgi:phosphate transport system substrate-binding protein